jgi:hypothetical protein
LITKKALKICFEDLLTFALKLNETLGPTVKTTDHENNHFHQAHMGFGPLNLGVRFTTCTGGGYYLIVSVH